ncbi:MAG: hypothetical protein ACJ786_08870 [Catenulispora sp.]
MHISSRCTTRASAVRLALLAAAGAAILSVAACNHAGPASPTLTAEGGIGAAPSQDTTLPVQVAQTAAGGATGNTGNTGNGGNTGGDEGRHSPRPSTSASAKTSWPAAPVIVYFRIQQQPKCKGSSHQGPVVPLIIEWQVTGADKVTVSTDGETKSYPATGTETYVFECAGAAGTEEHHKYTLTAEHDGVHATKSLTASAVVN